ncbi:EF-hand domain-containing family member B [Labeo rohita]|uniref:EF-hand domain-containing family member B n=1 Tax=Labeo rohita TaxID=84645 RepID=A0ABQ8LY66_LABRO|nr:EF-hand domain-containing family member B [Labeo rohita]
MSLIERNSSVWRRRDPFPNVRAAGKLIPVGDRAKTCLQEITAGAGSVINPSPKTRFQERLRHLQEINYATSQKAPLGRSRVQGLPSWLDPEGTTFGVATLQLSNGGEIINPPKTAHQVKKEAVEGHQLYVRSHGSYFVGERVDRKYNWGHCGRESRFGVPTPHYNDGRTISRSLQWPWENWVIHPTLNPSTRHNSAKLVSKRCDDFREKTQPQTGKVHDPIAETLNVPSDHTFGVLMKPDSFGKDRQRALISAVRQHLKKSNYQNFSSLLEAFRYYDKKGQGKIDKEDLKEVCHQFNMIVSEPVLDDLMEYCDVDKDGLIDFMEFSNFLNWKDKMPITRMLIYLLQLVERMAWTAPANMQRTDLQKSNAVKPLIRPEDLEPVELGYTRKTPKTLSRPRTVQNNFITSSSVISAVVGGLSSADDRTYGVPTVRSDLPAPRIKRVSDRTNYGDEATAHDLLNPPSAFPPRSP